MKDKDQLEIRVKMGYGESLDLASLDKFQELELPGFCKARVIKSNVVQYLAPRGISLQARLAMPMNGLDLLFLLEHIIVAAQQLISAGIPLTHLIMDPYYIFLNEPTRRLHFLYVPTETIRDSGSIKDLLRHVLYHARPQEMADRDLLTSLAAGFEVLQPWTLNEAEGLIWNKAPKIPQIVRNKKADTLEELQRAKSKKGSGASLAAENDTDRMEDAGGAWDDMPTDEMEHANRSWNKGTAHDAETPGGVPERPGTPMFLDLKEPDFDEPTGLMDRYSEPELDDYDLTRYLRESEDLTELASDCDTELEMPPQPVDCTILLPDPESLQDQGAAVSRPTWSQYGALRRKSTGEMIRIDKPVFRLGREHSGVDYCVADNPAISRGHADIITRSGCCYVKDNNAQNCTYLNGQRLTPACEYLLHDGDALRLANEEFVFQT